MRWLIGLISNTGMRLGEAARRIVEGSGESKFAFSRYCNQQVCNANSASNGLNKWLHQTISSQVKIHRFRHSHRDRLRAVECPTEVVDAIGGWHVAFVGQRYGMVFHQRC